MSTAEHILMEGDELDEQFDAAQNRTPQQHFHVVNRSHALQTEMILFEGGWLSLRQHKRSKPGEAQMINLSYLDPRPQISRYFAKRTLWLSAALGLIGVIIAMIVNIFLDSSALGFAISVIGVLVFTGLTAYDTQRMKGMYYQTGDGTAIAEKGAIMGALSLYLNFINLFMMLLHLFGGRD